MGIRGQLWAACRLSSGRGGWYGGCVSAQFTLEQWQDLDAAWLVPWLMGQRQWLLEEFQRPSHCLETTSGPAPSHTLNGACHRMLSASILPPPLC